ncbi:MAG: PilZ domain-containing protein [Nitrospirota bacterium]
MSDRLYRRVRVNIDAEIITYNVPYPAFISDISERGIHLKIANMGPSKLSKPETKVDLKFRLPSGETIKLFCRGKWSCKNTSKSVIENIGVEVIDPPDEYKEFCRLMSPV